jgi:hypothetical protein
MAITYQLFFAPQLIPAADTLIYTVPSTPPTTILKSSRVRLANGSAAAVAITLYAVPPAGAAGAANNVFPAVSVGASDYIDVDVPDMSAGYSLHALAGTAGVVTISQLDGFLKS